MQKNPLLSMAARDLCELHASLDLFRNTYWDCEGEAEKLLQCIQAIYARQYGADTLPALRNPRGAGRKSAYPAQTREDIAEMRRQGKSYRAIAQESGIPRSTIHRLIGKEGASQN